MSPRPDGHIPAVSIVTPAYNEALSIPLLYERLRHVLDAIGITWEWVVVDDHSSDTTFTALRALTLRDARVRGVRLARNFGSHAAISCGLNLAAGRCAVVMAADLQDPPETLPALLHEWRQGAQVVWAVRANRAGERRRTIVLSRAYYWLMRRVVGIRNMPPTGADFALFDRQVIDAIDHFRETNVSLLALVTWMGYRQVSVAYGKQIRLHGRSGWTLTKKIKLAVDSVTAFTFLPIRLMSAAGCLLGVAGFAYAGVVVVNAVAGRPVEGWSSIMVVVLLVGGVQMVMTGILGEYLWRTLDEVRARPRYLIEAHASFDHDVLESERTLTAVAAGG